ncbi:MAG: HRDC domain-containing protein [Planctomycetales bacterium]|nr:HRDC domain-containing protein [Planctomycetales bacterium]
MQYDTITTPDGLRCLCERLSSAKIVALDTEFVAEHTYFPELCLVQVAADGILAVIDTVALPQIDQFWNALADGEQRTVVHAGRQELLFALEACGRAPANLFDTQIAAGLVSNEYPAGYAALVQKMTGVRPPSGETRTDWRRRPLGDRQIEYALADVTHLLVVYDRLVERLESLNRLDWAETEISDWQLDIDESRSRKRWRRVSGISGLSRRSLAAVREIWHWRDEMARRRNVPAKRILRDDLIVELAKRGTADPKRISAVRGFDRRDLRSYIPELSQCIARALAEPDEALPSKQTREYPAQLNVLGQFLNTAVTCVCRRNQLAASLVGTASDVRELIAHLLGFSGAGDDQPPKLSVGWRAEVVGNLVDDLLAGRLTIRIHDPLSDDPLRFEASGKDNSDSMDA